MSKEGKCNLTCFFLVFLFFQYNKGSSKHCDPFYEAQENHNLIGVANIFLECLFHDVRLQYAVPIISQQGEVRSKDGMNYSDVSHHVSEFPF